MSQPENNWSLIVPSVGTNNKFHTFERLHEQRIAVYAILRDKKATKVFDTRLFDLSDGQWFEGMNVVLRPFYMHMSTRVISSEEYPIVSGVNSILYSLLNKHLDAMDTDCVAAALFKKSDLENRFSVGSEVESIRCYGHF